jgi:hypothetical protein
VTTLFNEVKYRLLNSVPGILSEVLNGKVLAVMKVQPMAGAEVSGTPQRADIRAVYILPPEIPGSVARAENLHQIMD